MRSAGVLGANSMLGAELDRQLRAAGITTIHIGRHESNDVRLDLDAPTTINDRELPAIDVLFHCASAFGDDTPQGQRTNASANVMGCHAVLDLLERMRCTHSVYAGSLSSILGAEATGRSSYGLSKSLGEQILTWGLTERKANGVFCSLRLPQLFDTAGRCSRHQAWFGRIIAYASRGLDLNMPPPGAPRNFMHIEDAAGLMIAAGRSKLAGVWNASHPESMTYLQIAYLAYRTFANGGQPRIALDKTPFRQISIPDSAALYARLGRHPQIKLARGLEMIRDARTAQAFGPMDVH